MIAYSKAAAQAGNWITYNKFSDCNEYMQEQKEYDEMNSATDRRLQRTTGPTSAVISDTNMDYDDVPTGEIVENGFELLKYFESKYVCSGICTPSLFYYSLELETGIPNSSCLTYLKDEIGDSMTYLGVTSLIVGILMCLVFAAQYMLWCKYEDPDAPKSELYGNNRN